jgi:plasmid stabilization system protein ParE
VTVRIGPDARRDIEEAVHWYEDREPGLGADVIAEIDAAFQRIELGPDRYPVSYRDLRRALVHRFPYSIYFSNNGNETTIVAVLHQRRDLEPLAARSR